MPSSEPQLEAGWRARLHAWGLEGLAAAALEATSPLHLVTAQLLYLGQPLLAGLVPHARLEALARWLEDPAEARALADRLREGVG